MPDHFRLLAECPSTRARRGVLTTRHGQIQTPIFMPVGTQGTVKGLTPQHLRDINAQIILSNTYHLNLRPGSDLVARMGGLHQFMGWNGPILTDSGGFQAFSLSELRKITDDGISFKSHLDGAPCFLGPKEVMSIQMNLGSDIAMVIDECAPYPCERGQAEAANRRTSRWAAECLKIARESGFLDQGHHVFAIAQGSVYEDLRRDSAKSLADMDFPGHAIGGVSVGEPEPHMLEQVEWAAEELPRDKPRYVMGVGTPPQLLKMIARGADMFDCVMPSRAARHGTAFTPFGKINLRNHRFKEDQKPLVEGLANYTCQHFTRAYLRHLLVAEELLGGILLTIHNLHFFLDLMDQARFHLEKGDYGTWHLTWIERYEKGDS